MSIRLYQVNITPTAEQDLVNRYDQIKLESPQNALNWYLRIVAAMESLEQLAERCPIAPEDADLQLDIRHLVIGDYRVLYRINGNTVDILHLRHSSMDRVW